MSRRRRALAFLALAALAAAGAATLAGRYGAVAARGYGPMRPVVVVAAELARGERIGPAALGSALRVRRVPARFVPPGTFAVPAEALGLIARIRLPAGSYLQRSQLAVARPHRRRRARLAGGRRPVEIAVGGAGALLGGGATRPGSRVDVVVSAEPSGPGPGRTYVAAADVPLLGLRPGPEGPGPEAALATLGLTRRQALRLIAAESFARRIALLPRG